MQRMLNTLYVTSEDAWLRKDGANIVVEVDGVERSRAPLHMLEGVVSFARPGASPALIALNLVNRRQIAADDFVLEEAGAVRRTDPARRRVLVAWQERKRDGLRHPFLDETVPLGLVAHIQAQLLARHLRGDLDGYPGFIWR